LSRRQKQRPPVTGDLSQLFQPYEKEADVVLGSAAASSSRKWFIVSTVYSGQHARGSKGQSSTERITISNAGVPAFLVPTTFDNFFASQFLPLHFFNQQLFFDVSKLQNSRYR
jgi:hypothetical protein